jgi:hypothetical protein
MRCFCAKNKNELLFLRDLQHFILYAIEKENKKKIKSRLFFCSFCIDLRAANCFSIFFASQLESKWKEWLESVTNIRASFTIFCAQIYSIDWEARRDASCKYWTLLALLRCVPLIKNQCVTRKYLWCDGLWRIFHAFR